MNSLKGRIWTNFKKKIFAGLIAVAPIALTYFVLITTLKFLDRFSGAFLKYFNINIPGLGFFVSIALVYALGLLITTVLGNKLFSIGEKILTRIPLINTVYNTIKQLTHAFSGTGTKTFRKVVYIEYPRKDAWTLAFVTGSSENGEGVEFYHLFVPTTPNPTSGFFLMIPQKDTVPSDISVETGLKAIISGGLLAPSKHRAGEKKDSK